MNNSFLEQQFINCINDFYKLYDKDLYISKKTYEKYIDNYKDIFPLLNKYNNKENKIYKRMLSIAQNGYKIIDIRNKKYIEKHLNEEKEYFDNIFLEVDPNIILDENQRRAILIDEDYSLIIAGAGSGKTTTMAAKVKYLVERKNIKPNEIIVLSFTNKAAQELNEILNDKFKLNVEVLTFHKLGMKFLRNTLNKCPEIIGEKGMYKIISDYFLEEIFIDKNKLQKYMQLFPNYLRIDMNALKFENYNEYYEYYTNLKYEENKNNLEKENKRRIKNRLKYNKTINGEYVRSEGEVKIANYLFKNNISYTYEEQYPFKIQGNRSYNPDFTIHNIGYDYYIEYYGLAKLQKDKTIISEQKKYVQDIYQKRKTHQMYNTICIELFGQYEDDYNYLPLLAYNLKKLNIMTHQKNETEIFYRLLETSKDSLYMKLVLLIQTFINLFKEFNYSIEDFEILKKETNNEIVKEQLELLKEVYMYYDNKIHKEENFKIDFQDMINYAYRNMETLKKEKQYIDYKYVIIDEYQDISLQRYNFTKKISDLFKAKIIAVGDDWQTIFSFSGSDIELFTKFYESMGYAEITTITKTYRNSQELINLAGEFIQKNNAQLKKQLISDKHMAKPVEIVKYNYDEKEDDLPKKLEYLIGKINYQNSNHKILLLTRFNDEIYNLLSSKLFYKTKANDTKLICKKYPNVYIDIMTVHKSKGLGYDQVILLNSLNVIKGFPSQLKDEEVIKLIKGNTNIEEYIEYPEERRLFYVALTRTKNKLYIMTPYKMQYRSDFIKEIEDNDYVLMT